jgi:hypothetical protein
MEVKYLLVRFNNIDFSISVISVWDSFRVARCLRRKLNKIYRKRKSMYRFEVTGVPYNKLQKFIL